MKICWVLGSRALDHAADSKKIKTVAPIWGSHTTWRTFETDNVICHDIKQAQELLKRAFQAVCNFYIHQDNYVDLQRPTGVKMYGGKFDPNLQSSDEIIACHLVSNHDIVLLLGFDLSDPNISDKYQQHQALAHLRAIKSVILNNPETQWVLVDNNLSVSTEIGDLPNFTCDTMENVIQLLV